MSFCTRRAALPLCLLSALTLATGCQHHGATSSAVTTALQGDASQPRLPQLHWPNDSDYAPAVQAFYSGRSWSTAWLDGHKPTAQAQQLIELFSASGAKGLNPEDYDALLWGGRVAHLASASDQELAQFDLAMTVTTMRYISSLHIGRVNPSHFAFGVSVDAKKYDLPQFLAQQVISAGNIAKALGSIEPQTPEYRDTLDALVRYQAMAAKEKQSNWQPLPAPAKPIVAGSPYPQAQALSQRLQLVGDLPGSAAQPNNYDATLAEAVKHFQLRHGLPNDGKLTPQTVAALNVPLSIRVHQLEDSLERWRWLSDQYLDAPILVNLPEFALRAREQQTVDFMMKVVVGDRVKEDHQTPVLTEMMKYVVMRPYWTVTETILKKEIIPHMQGSKSYLADKNFEIVDRGGKVVAGAGIDGLEHGGLTVREKPGPTNSLGLIKFMFPNKYNIYLHSTPATELFDRTKRDFSHGCIRVQDPEKLADWLFRDDPDWTPDKIHDAMENGEDNHTVPLKKPVPVVIFYATALVIEQGPEKGQVHFFDDMYGYDRDLEATLAQGMPYPVKPEPKAQDTDTE